MLRIAHVISARNYLGGAERIVRSLVSFGDRAGWPQVVLNPFAVGWTASSMVGEGSTTAYVPLEGDKYRDLPLLRRRLRRSLEDFGPDIIHVHLFHASSLVASLGHLGESARMLTHHHGDIYRARRRAVRYGIDRFASRRYEPIVAVSGAVKDFLIDAYGIAPSRVITIRNGWEGEPRFDMEKFTVPTVVTVGNLRPEKDQVTLLYAFAFLRARLPEAQLIIVGDGSERHSLESLTARLQLESAVTFTGICGDVWPLLAKGHVFAMSSVAEPLGIAAMEAMAAALPVVAPAVGGLTEIIDHEVTGVLVNPKDPRGLGMALLQLLSNPAEAAAMGDRARASVQSKTMTRMAERYGELYERLAG